MKLKGGEIGIQERMLLAEGWNNPYHQDLLVEYRDRYFSDMA